MKRGFIRSVFGDCKNVTLQSDIQRILNTKYNEPYETYVFGKDNALYMESLGIKCKLINDEPIVWDMDRYIFRHKMEVYKYAMEEDRYDEIIYLDWDTQPLKNIPSDFWEQLGKKELIQGCLYSTGKRKYCKWRPTNLNIIINTSFLYLRDKLFPSKFIKTWESLPDTKWYRYNDEIAIAKFIDDNYGGWVGIEKWFDMFEPKFSHLERKSMYNGYRSDEKDMCFLHRWH